MFINSLIALWRFCRLRNDYGLLRAARCNYHTINLKERTPFCQVALRHRVRYNAVCAAGFAVNLASLLLDYSVAYAFVGFAGLLRGSKNNKLATAALIGCVARFIIHFISGVTVYAEYMPETFLGMQMPNPFIYSILYNGTYMLPNTIIAVIVCLLIAPLLDRVAKSH